MAEYAEKGELFALIESSKGMKEPIARTLFKQCLSSVDYIHKKNIAHRDIKPENFFLDKECNVKLADFGLSKKTVSKDGQQKLLKTRCGSASYMAPELLKSEDEKYDGKKADIFSLGVVLYLMLTAQMPFLKALDRYYQILTQDSQTFMKDYCKTELTDDALDLILGMLRDDPKERLTIE